MTPIGILHTEAQYEAALAEFERYFDEEPAPGSPEADRFELLGLVLAKYEDEHFPMPVATPLEALKFAMEQRGHAQTDLAALLHSRSRASEVLSGRRSLSIDQIRLVSKEWRIPLQALVGEIERA